MILYADFEINLFQNYHFIDFFFFPGKHTQTRCVVIFFPLCNVLTNSKKRVMQITSRLIDETEYLLGCNIIYDGGPQT